MKELLSQRMCTADQLMSRKCRSIEPHESARLSQQCFPFCHVSMSDKYTTQRSSVRAWRNHRTASVIQSTPSMRCTNKSNQVRVFDNRSGNANCLEKISSYNFEQKVPRRRSRLLEPATQCDGRLISGSCRYKGCGIVDISPMDDNRQNLSCNW